MRMLNLIEAPYCVDLISKWHYDAWGALYPDQTLDGFRRDLIDSLSADPVPSSWVLEEDGAVIGSASIIMHDMSTNTDLSPWLANVFIRPDKRGRGLGTQLVLCAQNEIGKLGVSTLYLYTEDTEGFYEKLGWRVLREELYEGRRVSIMKYTCG